MRTIHNKSYRSVIRTLRNARKKCKLTQGQVALILGWRRTAISNIETCERRIDLLETYQLSSVYGLSLADLQHVLESNDEEK